MAEKFSRRSGRWRDERGRFVSYIYVVQSRARSRKKQARTTVQKAQRTKATRRRQETQQFTEAEEAILDDVRQELRGTTAEVGQEFELTATTRGGTPESHPTSAGRWREKTEWEDPRKLHLKLRVIVTKAMPVEVARLLVRRAIETGDIPSGIELRWIDWAKGEEGQATEGTLTRRLRKALGDFYGALTKGQTRFEGVR